MVESTLEHRIKVDLWAWSSFYRTCWVLTTGVDIKIVKPRKFSITAGFPTRKEVQRLIIAYGAPYRVLPDGLRLGLRLGRDWI